MTTPPHAITDESVTVVIEGRTFTVRQSSPNFEAARLAAFNKEWDKIPGLASPGLAIEHWLRGRFALTEGFITYDGMQIDSELNQRMQAMAAAGTDPSGWLKFWDRLAQNPSYRSVTQLYAFLTHEGIPIDEDTGFILAYKSVTEDYKDFHTKTYDNSPGSTHEMPRNQISDDPRHACHAGFHVGALGYARSFGGDRRLVIVRVDPADVVCVPYDSTSQKVRVCRYEVVGNYSGSPLPNTSTRDDARDIRNGEFEDDDGFSDDDDTDVSRDTQHRDTHTQSLTTEDRDGNPIPPTCAYCGNRAELCTGEPVVEDMSTTEEDRDGPTIQVDLLAEEMAAARKEFRENLAGADYTSKEFWTEFNGMDSKELAVFDLGVLRKYARFGLDIFGASKLPGGKDALITRILEIRRK